MCGVVWCSVGVVWCGCGVVWVWCGVVWCTYVHVCLCGAHHQWNTLLSFNCVFQLKSSYEGKCRDLDRAEENHHRLQTNPQSKPTDVQKVSGWVWL